ncbi:MAG: VWA domain-containing protein, partial [Elusimicrobia bacterium]|nr:VWA domain-containing protein [Elusimicrobiota bacterium]
MRLLHPWLLLLALPVLAAAAAAVWRPGGGRLSLPAGERLRARAPSPRARAARVAPPVLLALALCLIAAALARPQKTIKF